MADGHTAERMAEHTAERMAGGHTFDGHMADFCTQLLTALVNRISRGLNSSHAQYFKKLQVETPGKIWMLQTCRPSSCTHSRSMQRRRSRSRSRQRSPYVTITYKNTYQFDYHEHNYAG
jgi:hypothetical protein